jgi:hypothetical protein
VFWFGRNASIWDWHLTTSGLTLTQRPFGISSAQRDYRGEDRLTDAPSSRSPG